MDRKKMTIIAIIAVLLLSVGGLYDISENEAKAFYGSCCGG